MQVNEITDAVIGAAIEVHKVLGLGLLESAYDNAFATNSRYESCLLLWKSLYR